jgi:hypothetical protein
MNTITKKLGEQIFVWDPKAFNNKGYWFVLGKKGGYGKAASKKEAESLGKAVTEQNVDTVQPGQQASESASPIKTISNIPKQIPLIEPEIPPEKEMSYRDAEKIRETKITEIITRKIIEGGTISSSIKSGISEKTKAKAIGIKQAFDLLNIAKKLTGPLGAAMLGRATGRKQEDLQYFTGVKPRNNNISSVNQAPIDSKTGDINNAMYTKVSEGQKQNVKKGDSVSNVLAKLYNLTKQYRGEDIKRMELERDLKKEKVAAEDRWHQELIEAITGKKNKGKKTAIDQGASIFDTIENFLDNLLETLGVLKLIGRGAGAAGTAAALAPAAAASAPAAAAGAGAEAGVASGILSRFIPAGMGSAALVYGALLSPWVASAYERRKIEENPNAPEYKDNPYAMKVRGEVKTEEEGAAKNRAKGYKQFTRPQIKQAVDSKIDDNVLKEEYGENRTGLEQWLKEHTDAHAMYQSEPKTVPDTIHKLGLEPSTAGQGRGDASAIDYERRTTPDKAIFGVSPKGMRKAIPLESQPNKLGQRVQDAINKNNESKMDESIKPKTTVIDNSKNINSSGRSTTESITVDSVPVRNDERTWQKLQKSNLRPI